MLPTGSSEIRLSEASENGHDVNSEIQEALNRLAELLVADFIEKMDKK